MDEEQVELFAGRFVKSTPVEKEKQDDAETVVEEEINYGEIAQAERVDFLAHLRNMKKQVDEFKQVLEKAKPKILAEGSANGVTLLQVRNHCLLEYLEQLASFGAAKASGGPVSDAISELVFNKCVLEKIKPLEHKMKYQLEKYKDMEKNSQAVLRANPTSMLDDTKKQHSDGLVAAQYQPPQIMANMYPKTFEDQQKEARFARSSKAHAKKSVLMEEVVAEMRDAPMEAGRRAAENRRVKAFLKKMKETEELEEEMMQRIPLSKKDKQMMKQIEQMQTGYGSIMDFEKQEPKSKDKKKGDKKKGKRKH